MTTKSKGLYLLAHGVCPYLVQFPRYYHLFIKTRGGLVTLNTHNVGIGLIYIEYAITHHDQSDYLIWNI